MSDNLKDLFHSLELIAQIKNNSLRTAVLNDLKDNKRLYKALREVAINVIQGNIKLNKYQKTKLRKHAKILSELGSAKVKRSRKQKLVQQSGGYLQILVPVVTSLLGTVLNGIRK